MLDQIVQNVTPLLYVSPSVPQTFQYTKQKIGLAYCVALKLNRNLMLAHLQPVYFSHVAGKRIGSNVFAHMKYFTELMLRTEAKVKSVSFRPCHFTLLELLSFQLALYNFARGQFLSFYLDIIALETAVRNYPFVYSQ